MIADTSDIHALSASQHRHAEELTAVAADLAAARISPDAFGSVGAGFLSALNAALTHQAEHVTLIAGRLSAAGSTASRAANAYAAAETAAGQSISMGGY
jgi:hypothetical protein